MARIENGKVDRWTQRAYYRIFRKGSIIEETSVGALPSGDVIFWQKTPDKHTPDVVIIKEEWVKALLDRTPVVQDKAFEHSRFQKLILHQETHG